MNGIWRTTRCRGDPTYHGQWFTNDPDTYCNDEPVEIDGLLFCNGVSNELSPSEAPFVLTGSRSAGA